MLRQQFRLVDRAKQRRDGNLALAVDFDGDDVAVRGLELQPGAAVRNELRVAQVPPAGLVALERQIHARGAHELRDDDTLGAIDNEGAHGRHEREISHEDLLLLDLAGLLDQQLHIYPQRSRVRRVALPAFLLAVLRLVEPIVAEAHFEPVAGEVLDRRDFG